VYHDDRSDVSFEYILWKIGRHREGAIHIRLCEYLSVKDLKDTARFEVAATVSRRSRLLPLEMLAIHFSVFKYSITTDGKVSIILIQRYKLSIYVCICLYIRECVPLISIDSKNLKDDAENYDVQKIKRRC